LHGEGRSIQACRQNPLPGYQVREDKSDDNALLRTDSTVSSLYPAHIHKIVSNLLRTKEKEETGRI
jgi:hypothetical protein